MSDLCLQSTIDNRETAVCFAVWQRLADMLATVVVSLGTSFLEHIFLNNQQFMKIDSWFLAHPLARPLCAVRACHNLRQSRAASRHIFGGKSLTTWCIKLHSIHQPSYYYCNTETIYIVLSFHITINGLNTSWIEVRIIPQTSYCSECNNEHFSLKLCEKVIQPNINNWRHLNKSAKNHATFPHINRTVTQPPAAYEISKPLHSPVLGQMWNLQTSLYSYKQSRFCFEVDWAHQRKEPVLL